MHSSQVEGIAFWGGSSRFWGFCRDSYISRHSFSLSLLNIAHIEGSILSIG